jgi:hypothetical protein
MASPEIASNLEDTGEIIFSPDGDPVPNLNTGEVIVECVDNSGMEDKFDTGIDYVGEYHPDSHGEMIYVFDKNGERRDCFSSRFNVKSSSSPLRCIISKNRSGSWGGEYNEMPGS